MFLLCRPIDASEAQRLIADHAFVAFVRKQHICKIEQVIPETDISYKVLASSECKVLASSECKDPLAQKGLNVFDPGLDLTISQQVELFMAVARIVWQAAWGPRLEEALRAGAILIAFVNQSTQMSSELPHFPLTPLDLALIFDPKQPKQDSIARQWVSSLKSEILAQSSRDGKEGLASWWRHWFSRSKRVTNVIPSRIGKLKRSPLISEVKSSRMQRVMTAPATCIYQVVAEKQPVVFVVGDETPRLLVDTMLALFVRCVDLFATNAILCSDCLFPPLDYVTVEPVFWQVTSSPF